MDPTPGLAADGRTLDRLKLDASRDPARAAKAAASQFEALFMQSLLRGMRDTVPKSGLTGGSTTDTYTSMLDQQLVQNMAGRPGGLGEVIARQLSRHYGSAAAAGAGAGNGAAGLLVAGARGLPVTAASPDGVPGALAQGGAAASATAAASSGALAMVLPRRQPRGEDFAVRSAGIAAMKVGARASTAASTTAATAVAPGATAEGARGAEPRTVAKKAARTPAVTPAARPEVLRAIDIVRADPKGASNAVRAAAAAATASGQKLDGAALRQAEFVHAMWPHAVAAQRRTGTPAHLVIGQAALESGWGQRQIRQADGSPSYNLFGIKAGRSWTGKTVETTTTEFVDGRPMRMRQRFRAYESYAEAFADWSRLMKNNPRYDGVMTVGHDPKAYARQMQSAGYATDPAYADKLEKTIRKTLALRRLVI